MYEYVSFVVSGVIDSLKNEAAKIWCESQRISYGILRLAAQGPYKIGLNEVAIGITVPQFGIEVARQRLTPAYFSRTVMTGDMFAPPDAVTAGFFDRIVPAASLDATVDQAAETLSR